MLSRRWLLPLLLLLGLPRLTWAQSLTDEQYAAYRTDVLTTHAAEFAVQVANSDWAAITAAYNALQSPVYWGWKTALTAKSIYEDTDADNGVWDWTVHMAQTVAERGAWDTMMAAQPINPSLPQTRGAFQKIYSGNTTAQIAQKAHLFAISRRPARRIEALLIKAGSGDGSTATPSTLGYEGQVTYADTLYAVGGGPHP